MIINERMEHLSGAIVAPFIDELWNMSGNNPNTLIKLYDTLNNLYTQENEKGLLDILHLLHLVLNLDFPQEIAQLSSDPEAQSYFLDTLLLDIEDIIQEFIWDDSND